MRHLEASDNASTTEKNVHNSFIWKGKYFETEFSKKLNELSISLKKLGKVKQIWRKLKQENNKITNSY